MNPFGVGIDILSLKKAGAFLGRHGRKRVARILSPREYAFWKKKHFNTKVFAKFFCAKEAFFKACAGTWLGMDGWSGLEVRFERSDQCRVLHLKKISGGPSEARGVFFEEGDYVGAQVMTGFKA